MRRHLNYRGYFEFFAPQGYTHVAQIRVKFGVEKSIFKSVESGKTENFTKFRNMSVPQERICCNEQFHKIFNVCGKCDDRLNVKVLGIRSRGSGVVGF